MEVRKKILIIGGSSGLGLATAQKLARHNFDIYIVHRDRKQNLPHFENAVEEMRLCGATVKTWNKDALSDEALEEILTYFVDEQVELHAMLHAVAKGNLKPMVAANGSTLEEVDFQLTIQAMGTNYYKWAKAIIDRKLYASGFKLLAFTSEGAGRAWPNYAAVSAAKATLEAINRSMALEFAPLGCTANIIQAGVTDTPSLRMIPGSEALKIMAAKRNPFLRLTKPEDVANAVHLLLQPEASWINGAVIPVDGGESIV